MCVGGLCLCVSVVRRGFFDFPKEVLFDIKLTDVRNGPTTDGVVREKCSTVMDDG